MAAAPMRLLRAAESSASEVRDCYARCDLLRAIGATLSRAGDHAGTRRCYEAAFSAAGKMNDGSGNEYVQSVIVDELAADGQPAAAFELARAIDDYDYRGVATAHVAACYFKAGNHDEASRLFKAARADTESRLFYLVEVAQIQAAAGDAAGARDTIQFAQTHVQILSKRGWCLARIAEAQAIVGDLQEARETAAKVVDDGDALASALGEIAEEEARRASFEEARRVLRTVEASTYRDRALVVVTRLQAERGDFDGALSTASMFGGTSSRDEAIGVLVATRVKSGKLDKAQELVGKIDDLAERALAELQIADGYVRAGQIEAGLAIVRSTGPVMMDTRGWKRWDIQQSRVTVLANANRLDDAKLHSLLLPSDEGFTFQRDGAFRTVAGAIAREMGVPAAEAWANSRRTPRERAYVLLGAAEALGGAAGARVPATDGTPHR